MYVDFIIRGKNPSFTHHQISQWLLLSVYVLRLIWHAVPKASIDIEVVGFTSPTCVTMLSMFAMKLNIINPPTSKCTDPSNI